MASIRSRFSVAAAVLAASTMTAAPLAAAELPLPSMAAPGAYDSHAGNAFGHRRWRRHSRDHISTGDAIAGVAVLGVLAAIVGSAASNDRQERETYREPVRQARGWNNGGIDNAVDQCVNQVERGDDRVESVDNAARDADGWRVQGSLRNGDYFSCRLDNEGRIRAIDLGDDFAALDGANAVPGGPQLSDQAYAQARAALRTSGPGAGAIDGDINGPLPAYPGGPLPGEEGYEDSLGG
jgi:hypothetical protein